MTCILLSPTSCLTELQGKIISYVDTVLSNVDAPPLGSTATPRIAIEVSVIIIPA